MSEQEKTRTTRLPSISEQTKTLLVMIPSTATGVFFAIGWGLYTFTPSPTVIYTIEGKEPTYITPGESAFVFGFFAVVMFAFSAWIYYKDYWVKQ